MKKLYFRLNIALLVFVLTISGLASILLNNNNNIRSNTFANIVHNNTELGQRWHHLEMPVRANWQDVIWGKDRFVAVADDISQVAVSLDGLKWEMHHIDSTNQSYIPGLTSIAWGANANIFYAIGHDGVNNTTYYSSDGISWTSLPKNQTGKSVVFGATTNGTSLYAIIGDNNVSVREYKNNEFSNENNYTLNKSGFVDITYNTAQKEFVGIGSNSNNSLVTSLDGIGWSNNVFYPIAKFSTTGIAYGANGFVAVSNSGDQALYSSDGTNWQPVYAPVNNWSTVRWTGKMYVAVANDSTTDSSVMTSIDGINWIEQQSPRGKWQAVSGYYTTKDNVIDRIVALSDNRQDGMGLMISDSSLVQVNAKFNSTTTQEGAAIILNGKQVSDNAQAIFNNSSIDSLSYTINSPSGFESITINNEAVKVGTGSNDTLTYKIVSSTSGNVDKLSFELSQINTNELEIVVTARHIVTVSVSSDITTTGGQSTTRIVSNGKVFDKTSIRSWLKEDDSNGNRVDDFSVIVTKSQSLNLSHSQSAQQAPIFVHQEIVKSIDDIGSRFVPELSGGYGPGQLQYRSDNNNVATINSTGQVTVVGKGSARLYVHKQAANGWLQSTENSTILVVGKGTQAAPIFAPDEYNKYLDDLDFVPTYTTATNTTQLIWESLDPNIVEVDIDTGLISIKSIGTTSVSVYHKEDDNYAQSPKAHAQITVSTRSKSPQTTPTTPSIQVSTLHLKYGDEYTLQVEGGESTGQLVFASLDIDIVSVTTNLGTIVAKSVGQTTISVYRQGDEDYIDSDKVTITVIVSKLDQPIITTERLDIDLNINISKFNIKVDGGIGTGIFTYASEDNNIATVDQDGQVVLNSIGQVEIVVQRLGDNNYNDSNTLTIRLNIYDDVPVNDEPEPTGSLMWIWILLAVTVVLLSVLAVWLLRRKSKLNSSTTTKLHSTSVSRQSNTKTPPTKTTPKPIATRSTTTKQSPTKPPQPNQKNDKN